MNDAASFQNKLNELTQALRQLEILYEQYFSGHEKRAPLKERQHLEKQLRQLSNRRIIKTAHRFQFETLSSRYHTYATNWDRMQRNLDEGRLTRSIAQKKSGSSPALFPTSAPDDKLYSSLVRAHMECDLPKPPLDRERFALFLDRQKKQIRERWGNREVEFRVVIENGKPKLKAHGRK